MARRNYHWYTHNASRAKHEPSQPLTARNGIKARSQRGAFVQHWWAARWIEAMERLVDAARLVRGRSYARRGQVLSLEEIPDGMSARVQGSRPRPYKVSIKVEPLSDSQWEQVIDALAQRAAFSAQLLAGEMPRDIENTFQAAGMSLFPARRGDLTTECSCPDWANPCKHVAAVHYILGERFDEDPFLLFRLRGRSQEQILQALRQRRAGETEEEEDQPEEEPESVAPLEETLASFWSLGVPIETAPSSAKHASSAKQALRPSAIEMPILKRLGDPAFLKDASMQELLKPVYDEAARRAKEWDAALFAALPEAEEENGH